MSGPSHQKPSEVIVTLCGARFGRLTVPNDAAPLIINGRVHWPVICDCGNRKQIRQDNLRAERVVSCGCLRADRKVRQKARMPQALPDIAADMGVERLDIKGERISWQKSTLLRALVASGGILTRAAEIAGIHRSTHYC